ncbi:hypothetical protein [Carnobacterium maltaromaticum]|uniref:hypothetical protein n=1 Tax=Carnobacterium maltaromaticum TaxID=2751 RepID=UPI00295E7BC2|nr:hypothetical protein [Carnobacterium maltaromaticum]
MNFLEKFIVVSYMFSLLVLCWFMISYYFDGIRGIGKKSDTSKEIQDLKRHIYMNGLCLYFVLFLVLGVVLCRMNLF